MRLFRKFIIALIIILGIVWFYTNSLVGVSPKTITYYAELKTALKANGHKPRLFVISGRRWAVDNWFLSKFGGASSKSRHKKGEAIDIIVMDVNSDGESNATDVDIVYKLLDQQIIQRKGGIGTYKNEAGFFNRQMIHFDCGGRRTRWHR